MSNSSGQSIIPDGVEWWEILEWENMRETWKRLPLGIKMKLRVMGRAPSWDNYDSSSTTKIGKE